MVLSVSSSSHLPIPPCDHTHPPTLCIVWVPSRRERERAWQKSRQTQAVAIFGGSICVAESARCTGVPPQWPTLTQLMPPQRSYKHLLLLRHPVRKDWERFCVKKKKDKYLLKVINATDDEQWFVRTCGRAVSARWMLQLKGVAVCN